MSTKEQTDKQQRSSDAPITPEQWLKLRQHWYDGGRLSDWQIAAALNIACEAPPSSALATDNPTKLRGEERARYIHEHDCPKVWDFFKRHSTGSKVCPSCLMCGHQAHDRADWAITHGDLPDIYICRRCVDAAKAPPSATRESVIEECAALIDKMHSEIAQHDGWDMGVLSRAAYRLRKLKETSYVDYSAKGAK